MPISGEDVSFGWTFSATLIYVAFPAFLVLYLSVLKYFFGSFSTIRVMNVVKSNSKIRERYLELFTSRDSLMYHVSWSKSRGDFEESNKLMLDLQKLDKEIDRMETENSKLFGLKPKANGDKFI